MDFNQFQSLVVRTLNQMGAYSPEAVKAIMMIVAHESDKGRYLAQCNNGPAIGVIQMEIPTYNTVWEHGDNTLKYAAKIDQQRDFYSLEWDLRHNIFMARARLMMDSNPIPKENFELSRYLKRFWNTDHGKAKPLDYVMAYDDWRS